MKTKLVYFTQVVAITLLAVVIVSNLRSRAEAQDTAANNTQNQLLPSIYLAPNEQGESSIISSAIAEDIKLQVVVTQEQLFSALEEHPEISIVYLHPSAVNNVDGEQLRALHNSGKAVVAFNTALSELAELLDVDSRLGSDQDLRLPPPDGMFAVAVILDHRLNNAPHFTTTSLRYQDYFADVKQLAHFASQQVVNSRTP